MAPGGLYHCFISSSFNSENICWFSPTKSAVLGKVMEGLLCGYFSRRIRLLRLEDPSVSIVVDIVNRRYVVKISGSQDYSENFEIRTH